MPKASVHREEEEFPWDLGVFDAHCHPTDTMTSLDSIPSMKAKGLTVMATRAQDQVLVACAADRLGIPTDTNPEDWTRDQKIIPCFGWHPWFSHQMFDVNTYDGKEQLDEESKIAHYQTVLTPKSDDRDFLLALPDPRSFAHFLQQTHQYLERYPLALVGEIGLDKQFRIPGSWLPENYESRDDSLTPGGREGRDLSPYRVHMDHQKKVLTAQLNLAGELQRAVSIHGVQAHGILFETLQQTWKGYEKRVPSKRELKKRANDQNANIEEEQIQKIEDSSSPKPYPPRICLHSYSGTAETLKQYCHPSIPTEVFFSFSTTINFSHPAGSKTETVIQACPDDKILIESDLHTAGDRMDYYLEEIVRKVCQLKDWSLSDGVNRLAENWHRFVFGHIDPHKH
ncbi:Metallo-dependent hydrolase [Patellaria atrata CBS 101060]|uniref:Metallo-dependent hydrolase n=1 Tax=Patellaria atrata CBS 101060 TaxID=1346257 RepID=A0A9P4S705_9PEZI|nr:Metallo-dependent hydrolase [Patellaria atrata CBS 101060]